MAGEFGVTRGNQRLASNILTINNVKAAGLNLTQGLYTAGPFYWDLNEETRAFAQRFNPRHPKKIAVNEYTAGVYSTVRHYLKAVAALGNAKDGRAVVAKMKEIPVDDPLFGKETGPCRRQRHAPDVSVPGEGAERVEGRVGLTSSSRR